MSEEPSKHLTVLSSETATIMAKHLTLNRIRLVWGGWPMRIWSGTRKPRERERLRLSSSILHVNAVLTSHLDETLSGMKVTPVSPYKRPLKCYVLRNGCCFVVWVVWKAIFYFFYLHNAFVIEANRYVLRCPDFGWKLDWRSYFTSHPVSGNSSG